MGGEWWGGEWWGGSGGEGSGGEGSGSGGMYPEGGSTRIVGWDFSTVAPLLLQINSEWNAMIYYCSRFSLGMTKTLMVWSNAAPQASPSLLKCQSYLGSFQYSLNCLKK